jgi:hypothetical protein
VQGNGEAEEVMVVQWSRGGVREFGATVTMVTTSR